MFIFFFNYNVLTKVSRVSAAIFLNCDFIFCALSLLLCECFFFLALILGNIDGTISPKPEMIALLDIVQLEEKKIGRVFIFYLQFCPQHTHTD